MEEEREELSEEEEPRTQRFSVVIVWPPDTDEVMAPNDIQSILEEAITAFDDEATIEVTEISEPTY